MTNSIINKDSIAVIAVSGGMDSCVTAAIANQIHRLAFLHISYGQRTETRELQAFHDLADYYKVDKKIVIEFSHFSKIGGSALTDKFMKIAKPDLDSIKIPTTYVPFRNANILSACVSWAETIAANYIYLGAVFEDSSGYPDCRPEFFKAFQETVNLGTKPDTDIEIRTPIIHLAKAEIIKKGMELNAPLSLTWSCYQNEEVACGNCESCALRLRGFQSAGIQDPIPYVIKPDYT